MSLNNNAPNASSTYLTRVLQNDTFKRGLAMAAATSLIALLTEAVWPSSSAP